MRIVLAGAGYTNIDVAPYLKRKLPGAQITLISRHAEASLNSHLPELLTKRRLENLRIPIERMCKNAGVEFIEAEIHGFDTHKRIVYAEGVHVPYDYLLLDLGTEADTHSVPGLQHAKQIKGAHSYLELRQHVVTEMLKARSTNHARHKTFVVAGSGVTAIETATELHALTHQLCEQHLLFPQEIAVVLVHDDWQFAPHAHKCIEQLLEHKNIECYRTDVHALREDGVLLADRLIETRTLVWTKRTANRLLAQLGIPLDAHGAAIVDEYLRTADERIFAVGDNTVLFNNHAQVPKTAFMAFDEQRAVADNIMAAARRKQMRRYKPRKNVPIVITTGGQHALLLWGRFSWHGALPYRLKGWFAENYARRVFPR